MVFEGVAEAALLDASGAPQATRSSSSGARRSSSTPEPAASGVGSPPGGFVAAPPTSATASSTWASYADVVLRSRPRGYWRFESLADGAFPNEVPGGPPLRVHGPVRAARARAGNGTAAFQAGDPEQFLDTDAALGPPREPGHAVEFWFLSEGIAYASLVGLLPAPGA